MILWCVLLAACTSQAPREPVSRAAETPVGAKEDAPKEPPPDEPPPKEPEPPPAPESSPVRGDDWNQATPELASSGRDAYLLLPDRRVAHRTADDPSWEPLPSLPRCSAGMRFSLAGRAAVTGDGTLWAADSGCVSWWDGSAWHTQDLLGLGSIAALAAAEGEVIVVAEVNDGDRKDIRSFHGGSRGWRLYAVDRRRGANSFFPEDLVARARDEVVLISTASGPARFGGQDLDLSYRFDGQRWRRTPRFADAARSVSELDDGRLLVLGYEAVHVGWPGSWSAVPGLPHDGVRAIFGAPDDCWFALSQGVRRNPKPGGVSHWQGGTQVGMVEYPARGGAIFAGDVIAWSDHDVVTIVGDQSVPLRLADPPVPWPSEREAAALGVAPPLELPAQHARFMTLQSRTASLVEGDVRHAVIARPAEAFERCQAGLSWWLVRLEGGAITREHELGPRGCADRRPLVAPQIRRTDFDDDGRPELLVTVSVAAPLGFRDGMRLAYLAIIDPEGYRVEGAFGTAAARETSIVDPSARLYVSWERTGDTLRRDAAVWRQDGSRMKAPGLKPCTRDSVADTWTCPGPSLAAAAFGADLTEFPLPLPAPTAR